MTGKVGGVLGSDTRGLATVEYTVLLVLLVASALALWQELGASVRTKIERAKQELNAEE